MCNFLEVYFEGDIHVAMLVQGFNWQERKAGKKYPKKTFVVPRCLAIREPTAKRELSIR